jgi:hypothetical protein
VVADTGRCCAGISKATGLLMVEANDGGLEANDRYLSYPGKRMTGN